MQLSHQKKDRHIILGSYLAVLAAGLPFVPLLTIAGIRFEFFIFGFTLLGVALFHKHTFFVAVCGLSGLLLFKFTHFNDFNLARHFFGTVSIVQQIVDKEMRQGEWPIIANLLGLLLGFAILAKLFEQSNIPEILPRFLPDDWKGPFVLLIMVFALSSFLDNIAAAMIGGTIAMVVFRKKVHLGYVAAIVAASNAGGSGSVVGDTTTTMMWIDGISPLSVVDGYAGAFPALVIFGVIAAFQQDRFNPIQKDATANAEIKWKNIIVVIMILAGTIATNYLFDFPAAGVWIGIVAGALLISVPWGEVKKSIIGSLFLLSLVTCASLMPVETLPPASAVMALSLGFISAVFDNIPLTKLALDQGGYDWGCLAYTVGFGGSMIWFGSSAGVAISNIFPEARSTVRWLKHGWHIPVAYVAGFVLLILIAGWHPSANKSSVHAANKAVITAPGGQAR